MSNHISLPSELIPMAMLLIFIFLILIFWYRIRKSFISEWDHEIQIGRLKKRPILMTVIKMYTNLQSTKPAKLAEDVRNELLVNLALAYDKPTVYFLRMKEDPVRLSKYLIDPELVEFFHRPQYWASKHFDRDRSFFDMFKKTEVSDNFLTHLEKIVDKFEKSLFSISLVDEQREIYYGLPS